MTKRITILALITFFAIFNIATGLLAAPVLDTGDPSEPVCNPHSYTKLGNGIVRDNVTGLEWQQETAPGNYTWDQAKAYFENLTLSGHSDWRLPTIHELLTLVDNSIPYPGPTINRKFFTDPLPARTCWSSTTCIHSTFEAWTMSFCNGGVGPGGDNMGKAYVLAVRGGPYGGFNNFVNNGDGTITDTTTGLMWQEATAPGIGTGPRPDRYNWYQALDYCENLILNNDGQWTNGSPNASGTKHSDWRLPTKNELHTLVDYSRYNPSIDTTFFPNTQWNSYWSSTNYARYTNAAWVVVYDDGYIGGTVGDNSVDYNLIYVRAVRAGQCGLVTTTTIPGGTTTTTICSGPCCATAIYGENAEETELLREYRDNVLSKTPEGQEIIKAYCAFSPTITKLLEQMPLLKSRAKIFIDGMLPTIRKKVEESNKEQ